MASIAHATHGHRTLMSVRVITRIVDGSIINAEYKFLFPILSCLFYFLLMFCSIFSLSSAGGGGGGLPPRINPLPT